MALSVHMYLRMYHHLIGKILALLGVEALVDIPIIQAPIYED